MVNLFIGLVVDAIFTIKEHDKEERIENGSDKPEQVKELSCQSEMNDLKIELKEMRQLLVNIEQQLPNNPPFE
jgi:Tfp pilus assembly protein PilO